jgi:Ca-activated chloride channel family protein
MMRLQMNKPALPLFLLVALATSVSTAQEEPSSTVKVNVRLVNVFVTVTDAHGAPIGDLTKDNFRLSEDGTEQKISVFDKESA